MHSDHNTAWSNCLIKIKDSVGNQGFETWFKPIKPTKLENKILTIQVPSQFFYEYLEEHRHQDWDQAFQEGLFTAGGFRQRSSL